MGAEADVGLIRRLPGGIGVAGRATVGMRPVACSMVSARHQAVSWYILCTKRIARALTLIPAS